MAPLIKASKPFVSTSSFEGQQNATLEATACECPLVVSNIVSHREFLSAETADFASTEDDFVRAILRALRGAPDVVERVNAAGDQVRQSGPRAATLAYEAIRKSARARH